MRRAKSAEGVALGGIGFAGNAPGLNEWAFVKHGQVVQRVRFSVREPALFASAAQGPAINADNAGKRSHRYTEKRGQLFQPFDWEAAEGYFHILQ